MTNTTELYRLHSVSALSSHRYSLIMVRGDTEIQAICEVKCAEGNEMPDVNYLAFHSDEFNHLCTRGEIYLKPIGKIIFAFHECQNQNSGNFNTTNQTCPT